MLKHLRDKALLGDNVYIEVYQNGRLLRTEHAHNLITNAGKNLISRLLAGQSADSIGYLAIGVGNTAPTVGDTELQDERYRMAITRHVVDSAYYMLTTQTYIGSTEANALSIREAGLWTAGLGGTLFARVTHAPVEKNENVTLVYSWSIQAVV